MRVTRRGETGTVMTDQLNNFTDKQRLFIQFYVETLNRTKAATLAGYSPKTAYQIGSALLKKVEIHQEVDALLAEKVMSANEVLIRLAGHARGDMADFANIETGADVRDHEQSHLIKKYKKKRRYFKDDEYEDTIELELYDAQAALVHLGKFHKLFTDKTELTGADGGAININVSDIRNLSDDELNALTQG